MGLMLLAPLAGAAREAADRPNILWLMCEDASPTLGSYGDSYAVTPNIDRLAAKGVRYTRAFATAGVCAVARERLVDDHPQSLVALRRAPGPQDYVPPGAFPVRTRHRVHQLGGRKLAEGVKEAKQKLAPAKLGAGWGYSRANINRRARDADGSVKIGMNPNPSPPACILSTTTQLIRT